MSKMRMPEMSVVRFEESDVICSSLYLYGFNDQTPGNAGAKYNGNTYTLSNRYDIESALPMGDGVVLTSGGTNRVVTMLYEEDDKGAQYAATTDTGWYTFSNGYWRFSNQ